MINVGNAEAIPASFRDPNGFLFQHNGIIYRQINLKYREDYDHLMGSGLYERLTAEGFLVPHVETDLKALQSDIAYKVIKPEPIHFISYPYEWCFSQLKNAAIATLSIQKKALEAGMSLKDCSAYNIQFRHGKPILIDTLSFERYKEGEPWVAYRQFCQHFLAPLALMSYKDVRLNQFLRVYIDGIPLDLASSLLPFLSKFRFSLLTHIHLHSQSQKRYANKGFEKGGRKMGLFALRGLIDSLESAVHKLSWKPTDTEWASYYEDTNYSSESFNQKKELVAQFLEEINPKNVWDLGANTGVFSRVAAMRKIQVVSFDIDPAAVEKNYLECIKSDEAYLLPLCLDLANPSPAIGWENTERESLLNRGPADTVLALALVHHLAISNNVPLGKLAGFFGKICSNALVIEFVPKSDSQIKRLLATREDVFPDYTETSFENEFSTYFTIKKKSCIINSQRILYAMKRRESK